MRLPESRFKLTLLTTVAAFCAAIAVCQVFEWLGFPEQDQVKVIKRMAGWNTDFILTVVQVLFLMPPLEEFLFRYLLFRLPSRLAAEEGSSRLFVYRPSFLIAVFSSAVFSFAHYVDYQRIFSGRGFGMLPISNAFLALFGLGLVWCWLYRRTGRIWCNMLSHSLFNAINLVLALVL